MASHDGAKKWAPVLGELPTLDVFVEQRDLVPLLPLPYPSRPVKPCSKSSRLRQRHKRKLQVWKVACGMVRAMNGLHRGRVDDVLTSPTSVADRQMKATDARQLAVWRVLQQASVLARERRGLCLTGAQSAASILLKTPMDDNGYLKMSGISQVSMLADRIVEPKGENCIDMLTALPEEDSLFYSKEEYVVEREGKSETLFREIEAHYGFVGGEKQEYVKYLSRSDVQHLWVWSKMDQVKAVAGISTVLKKNQIDQRKLIMQCAANYVFSDPCARARLGMAGGAALTRCHVPGDCMSASACDEDSAFTFIEVPVWMRFWQAAPPLMAWEVWDCLPQTLQDELQGDRMTYVAPLYRRLAMGGTHSVYILMRINLHHVGKVLFNVASRSLTNAAQASTFQDETSAVIGIEDAQGDREDEILLGDRDWAQRQQDRRHGSVGQSGYTVQEWCDAVRAAKRGDQRVFVVMHFFSGERRPQDVQEWLEGWMEEAGLKLLMISVDLAYDPLWDFTKPSSFHNIYQLCVEGLIDATLGGPPCSTVARSRHVPLPGGGGPRPLRFRDQPWGRWDLKPFEEERVQEANTLWLNYMAVSEAVSSRQGAHLWEHPADPGTDPYPSVWATMEMQMMEQRVGAQRALLHQCPFGGLVPKLTCLSGTMDGLEDLDGIRCPGESKWHIHGRSIGRAPDGSFHTRRLQTYPAGLCRAMAWMVFQTLSRMARTNTGPTGARLMGSVDRPRISSWSTWSSRSRGGAVMLNEAAERGESCLLDSNQAAVYVHVDDTVCLGGRDQTTFHSDSVLDAVVGGLEKVGFEVSQQSRNSELTKVLGYEVQRQPALFRFPGKKMALLREAMFKEAEKRLANLDILRSLVGVWIHGALLRRDLLCIPHALFHFLDAFEDVKMTRWWPSAREEVRAMARVIPAMQAHVGAEILPWLFATDAMGQNEFDYGGFGIVATNVSPEEVKILLRQGEQVGRTVAQLDVVGGSKFGDRHLLPTTPFTLLPAEFFVEKRWMEVDRGRWKYGDHITIGEARVVVRLLTRLAAWPALQDHFLFSLQDNRPTACSMMKGRSPSFALNRILRQKAAICLAGGMRLGLPWVESAKQPADKASRLW